MHISFAKIAPAIEGDGGATAEGYYLELAHRCAASGMLSDALGCLHRAKRLVPLADEAQAAFETYARSYAASDPYREIVPDGYRVVTAQQPDFDALAASPDFVNPGRSFIDTDLAHSLFGIPASHPDYVVSFLLLKNDRPMVAVLAEIVADGSVGYHNGPVQIRLAQHVRRALFPIQIALDVLEERARTFGGSSLLIEDIDMGPIDTALGQAVRDRSYVVEVMTQHFIDLTQDDREIWADIRKSYRPLIKREQKSVKVFPMHGFLNPVTVQIWRDIRHCTYNLIDDPSFERLLTMVQAGQAEVAVGVDTDGRCVGVTVVIDDAGSSYYLAGHYLTDDCGHKESHLMVYDAIMRSKARGNQRFYTYMRKIWPTRLLPGGNLAVEGKKQHDVLFFLHGFSSTVERILTYRKIL